MSSQTPAAGLTREVEPAHSHPRTEAALQRLRQAMAQIEAEIDFVLLVGCIEDLESAQ